ncbi:hypothetical protein BH24CHL9_BH24CHL9_15330 [soil metagenome]
MPTDDPDGVPEAGSWVRLARRRSGDAAPVAAGRWHLVRGWVPDLERLLLACTRRDRDISWALRELGGYSVLRSASQPPCEAEVCARCRRWM